MSKIQKLTKEQEDYLPVFREKYLNLACDGKRIDRSKLEPAIFAAYDFIGKKRPLVIILKSPQQSLLAINLLKHLAKSEVGNYIKAQLVVQLQDQLGDQLRVQLWGRLGAQLQDQLGDQLRVQLGAQLGAQLQDQLWDNNFLWGSQDLYWICWARFAQEIGVKLKPETENRLNIIENISQQCEWWWPYDGICFVSEKPVNIKWDEGRLHGENEPAVLYEDGYAVYSWRGVNVPKEWIEDKSSLTPEMAITWENVEQRRCIAEIVGWHNVLEKLNAKTIDKDDDPLIGELLEVDIPDVGRERFLKVQCGTGRTFALPCPPGMKTALDAQAWLNFCTPDDILSIEFRT